MPLTLKPTRYAHPEGHTGVCYFTGEKGGLITCGADGDVRSWLDLMDDDPSDSCIAEQATACISKEGKIYVGNDNNAVQILNYPDLEKEGYLTRFSSTVSCLATTQNSSLIVSGACDMRIHVTNVKTSSSTELNGHEGPILAVTLDPKEEFVASSSTDGTVQIWNIEEKKSIHSWNVVPKGNSFFTAKCQCSPSFDPKNGKYLAYPQDAEVVVTERGTWKELFRLKSSNIKQDINICTFSDCGTKLAACSVAGEIVVWSVDSQREIGSVEHQQKAKITSLVWNPKSPTELAFCDSLGQLGCVDVTSPESLDDLLEPIGNGHAVNGIPMSDEDDDDDNVISLNKVKASVSTIEDQKSHSDAASVHGDRQVLPQVHLQEPFQPGSTPVHLLSRFMMWNDVGIVKCYCSEDGEESTIEVEFHDTTIHHGMHMNNFLRHTMAALSTEALALSCSPSDGDRSKLVVIMLQSWGGGSKEWSVDLPEGEESTCVAAGTTFVALATSKRHLRIFTATGIQREIVAIPGSVVTMNALGNHLLVAYHSGLGVSDDQQMSLMWLQVLDAEIKCQTLSLPLSPSNELMWLGLSDRASPTVMDADGVVRMYIRQSRLWRVVTDTSNAPKGKMDNYFIIGVSEVERLIRCVLCKGAHYPPTTPRPNIIELPLTAPLCQVESERSQKEAAVWQIGINPTDQDTALFMLIGYCCQNKLEHCVVDLCQNIAKQSLIELVIKYANKTERTALSKKLQTIAEAKDREKNKDDKDEDIVSQDMFEGIEEEERVETQEVDTILTPIVKKKPELVEIKPLTFRVKKNNPFLKKTTTVPINALEGMNSLPDKPQKPQPSVITVTKAKPKTLPKKKETFVAWFTKNKADLQDEFPELSPQELSKIGMERYKEAASGQKTDLQDAESKKRKLPDSESQDSEPKRSSKLAGFAFTK